MTDGTPDGFDRVVHDPARLMICTALRNCASADFVFLRTLTGLTAGNLSSHLSRLEQAGLVTLDRKVVGRTTRTDASLTDEGRRRVDAHWAALERLRNDPLSAPGPAG